MGIKPTAEAEWPISHEPHRMLKALAHLRYAGTLISDRKLRLVTVAAARLVWDRLPEGELREVIEVAEQRADGLIEQALLNEYRGRFYGYVGSDAAPEHRQWLAMEGMRSVFALVFGLTYPEHMLRTLAGNNHWRSGIEPWQEAVSHIIRDIFGNPFRPVALDPAWLSSDVVALARGIYTDRAFDRMPILADALQDAGCDHPDVLAHCRDVNQPHARGCWVVDLLLGKA
jgi:hypothetical protein